MKKYIYTTVALAILCAALTACADSGSSSVSQIAPTTETVAEISSEVTDTDTTAAAEESASETDEQVSQGIDYLALVNKQNALPDGWEDAIETVHMTNTVGNDVEVEKKAYDAYLALKKELEAENIFVDLDSSRRSIAEQQRIMDDFTEQYGADYAAKTVAVPGFSEHHTGLALDLYLIIDGKDVDENEDMMQYPEIWEVIHEKLAAHGFILRYLQDKEHITGYGYEPWHIRYIDDPALAQEITAKNITFEEYLGVVEPDEATVDLGSSSLFTENELKEAAIQVKCKFASFPGCTLENLRYAGDESNSEENLAHMKQIDDKHEYTQVVEFLSDFHTYGDNTGVFDPDSEMKDYQWWLAREADGGWQLLSWGY